MSQLFRLKNGTVLLSTEAPGGIYNSGQLKKIAELCSKELAIVKATEDQRLALFVKESEVENVAKQLRAMGLGFRHYQDSLHQPVSCLGELCEDHEQPAMATAMDITKEIASIQLNAPLKIGINGCARCCTPCHTLDIAIVGDASGYRISLGGKTRQMPEFASYFAEGVPPKELPKRLKAVIEAYKNLAEEGETLHDVIERCGVSDFVKALAPYSQDAAQREDPFAQEAAGTAESLDGEMDLGTDEVSLDDDLSLEADAILDAPETSDALPADDADVDLSLDADAELSLEADEPEADLSLDAEAPAADLETDLSVDDDLSIIDDQLDGDVALDEIPIEKGGQGSLEDDLSLGQDDALLDEPVALTAEEDELSLGMEESAGLGATAELDADFDASPGVNIPEDDIDLDAPDLGTDALASDDSLETLDDAAELDLEEPLPLEDDLTDDELKMEELDDSELAATAAPVDEDLEGLPELDEDLAPEEIPAPAPAPAPAPVAVSKPAPAPQADLDAEFGEDLQADVPDLSDEEESQFEQKLQASIDEESRLIAKEDKDPNVGDRQAALSLLESNETPADDLESIDLDDAVLDEPLMDDAAMDDVSSDDAMELVTTDELEEIAEDEDMAASADTEKVDDELEPINEVMEEFPEPGPRELAHIKSRQVGQKLQGSASRQQFKLSAITFQDEHMRVTFESGAYVDFDLSALGLGEERNFRLGVQNVSVTSTSEGYILEVDGMRLFHPKTSLPAAS